MKRWNRTGKLGATPQDATAVVVDFAAGAGVVNGPEDLPAWDAIVWRHQQVQVQRRRQQIVKATQAADPTGLQSAQS